MTNVVYEKPSVSESYLEKIDFSEDLPARVNRYTRDMTTVIQSHYHEELEFNLIYEKDSKIDFYVNGEKNEIHTGEVGLINSFDIHSSIPSLPTRGKEITGIKIFVNWGFLRSIFGENLSYERLRLFIPDKEANDKIRSCMNRISDYYFDTEISNRRFLIMATICEMLAYIKYEDKGNGSQNQADDGERFITYIHEMYQNPLTQSEVAAHFHYSKEYFCKIFKKCTGVSFKNYLTGIRLMNAVRLLNTTDKKVSEIAQETGFSDESRFIACFKEYYQQTPGYYRKQIKSI